MSVNIYVLSACFVDIISLKKPTKQTCNKENHSEAESVLYVNHYRTLLEAIRFKFKVHQPQFEVHNIPFLWLPLTKL